MLNILSLLSFANAMFLLFIAFYSISINRKSMINRTSFLECLLLSIWSFAYTFLYVAEDKETAWFWVRIGSIGWSGFMGVLVWFFISLTRSKEHYNRYLLITYTQIAPLLMVVFNLALPWISPAVDLVQSRSGLGWAFVNRLDNPLYWAYVSYILLGVVFSYYILNKWLKENEAEHFRKLAITFLAVDGSLIVLGFTSDLIVPMFTHFLPPITNILLIIFEFGYWYLVFKLDVFKKTSVEASEFVLDTIRDSYMILNEKGIIKHCNRATVELLQYDRQEIVGHKLIEFFEKDHYDMQLLEKLFSDQHLEKVEAVLIRKDGTPIHTIYSASVAEDNTHGFMGIIISFYDVSKQKKLEQELYQLAHYDQLTGLPNRRHFMNMLLNYQNAYADSNTDFAVLFMDLNGFKAINDTLGHEQGDMLLVEVARILSACLNPLDILARIGGDEYVMVMNLGDYKEELTDQLLKDRYRHICKQFESPLIKEEFIYPIGISVGYAKYSDYLNLKTLLKAADTAMYRDKYGE